MGSPAKIGYSGGKLDPSENERIRGMVAAKSLHTLVVISKSPDEVKRKVFHIKKQDKKKSNEKSITSTEYFFIMEPNLIRIQESISVKKVNFELLLFLLFPDFVE